MQSFHHHQFRDVSLLCQRKQSLRESVSVVIPTLNEESTIATIVEIIRESLVEKFPLVDEIVVVDSGSGDRTCERAAAAGARVFQASQIAEFLGDHPGKGENLWKSQFVTRGSICVFIDGDILDFHEGFVTGLVGPLLENASLHYAKGFYRRPLQLASGPLEQGGGRVSELLVRPFFSLFYPELCSLHQPLAGEYAVRRSLLEQLSFPTGYAVEAAHLIDVLALYGIAAFAQCDLDSRRHRNRPLEELGAMACSILHTLLLRAQRDGILVLSQELVNSYLRPHGSSLTEMPILGQERPPFVSLNALSHSS